MPGGTKLLAGNSPARVIFPTILRLSTAREKALRTRGSLNGGLEQSKRRK